MSERHPAPKDRADVASILPGPGSEVKPGKASARFAPIVAAQRRTNNGGQLWQDVPTGHAFFPTPSDRNRGSR